MLGRIVCAPDSRHTTNGESDILWSVKADRDPEGLVYKGYDFTPRRHASFPTFSPHCLSTLGLLDSKMAEKTTAKPRYFGMTGTWLTVWVTVACATDMTLFGYDQVCRFSVSQSLSEKCLTSLIGCFRRRCCYTGLYSAAQSRQQQQFAINHYCHL